jgi:hypothetical protein
MFICGLPGCGAGTVVEVDGDKYLLDLDGQTARLWEKAWGVKKA